MKHMKKVLIMHSYAVRTLFSKMRLTGLEPARLAALEPKSNVSASFTTGANETRAIRL